MCFEDLQKAYDSVDRSLPWKVLAWYGVHAKIIAIIRQFPYGMRTCVRFDEGEFSEQFPDVGLRGANRACLRLINRESLSWTIIGDDCNPYCTQTVEYKWRRRPGPVLSQVAVSVAMCSNVSASDPWNFTRKRELKIFDSRSTKNFIYRQ